MAANGEDNGNGNSNTVDVVIVGRESARQTTAKERSHSPWQRGADADIVSKQKGVSGSGLGGDTFPVNDLYIPRRPAEEKAQLHQDLCESKGTARIGIDDASLSMVIENTAKMRSWLNRYVLEKEVRLRQESARQTMAKERSHSPWQRGADADIVSKQKGVSSSGLGGDMFPVNDLYIPRRPAEEKAQLHQDLCESKRTARIGIDDASLSMVMENTAKMRSWLNRYVLEKEVELRQESVGQITNRERSRSPYQRDADADILWQQKRQITTMERSPYQRDADADIEWQQKRQITTMERSRSPHQRDADADIAWKQKWALYETQRTTRKQVDDAGPSRFVQDAEEEYSCSLRCLAEKEAELKQALLKLARTITEGADEEYSCSLHCLAEKEAELQQALLKLARTITEVRGSFGPLRAVNDAVEAVYAMSMHLVQDKQTINDSSTLQLSTQRELVPARPTTSQAPG